MKYLLTTLILILNAGCATTEHVSQNTSEAERLCLAKATENLERELDQHDSIYRHNFWVNYMANISKLNATEQSKQLKQLQSIAADENSNFEPKLKLALLKKKINTITSLRSAESIIKQMQATHELPVTISPFLDWQLKEIESLVQVAKTEYQLRLELDRRKVKSKALKAQLDALLNLESNMAVEPTTVNGNE